MSETKNTDWRNHTCGECGWWAVYQTQDCTLCRRSEWVEFAGDAPACPAFVTREEDEV